MARIALSRHVAQMCPTPRGPPHQTQLADPDATYLARAHNCDFVTGNKITVFDLGQGVEARQIHLLASFWRTSVPAGKSSNPVVGG